MGVKRKIKEDRIRWGGTEDKDEIKVNAMMFE